MAGSEDWRTNSKNPYRVRAGVELHETAILGSQKLRKDSEDGNTFFNMDNHYWRNLISKEKKPE